MLNFSDKKLGIPSQYFHFIAYLNLLSIYGKEPQDFLFTSPISGDIDFILSNSRVIYILEPDFPSGWKPEILKIFINMVVVELENGELGLGKISKKCLQYLNELNLGTETKKYSVIEFYEKLETRRELGRYISGTEKFLHQEFRNENAKKLINELRSIPPGISHFSQYECVVQKILDQFFDDCNSISSKQRPVSAKSYRFDICYYIDRFGNRFWDEISKESSASHIIVECKNSDESAQLGTAVSQVQKYFTSTNSGSCAIITIRKKKNLDKMKHYSKMVQDRSVFLLVLDDSDLEQMVVVNQNIGIFIRNNQSEVDYCHYTSIGVLYKMMQDARLDY
jgi:hypothetical protein